jgi:hypothetical protein
VNYSSLFHKHIEVRPLVQPIEGIGLGLCGRVVDVQVRERGLIVWNSGPFKNLILTQGLDKIATTVIANVFTYCVVGTGNTPPAANQTGLVAEAARTGNYLSGAGNCGTTRVTPTKITMCRTFDFPVGALNGNYSELGFSSSSSPGGNLFSRVLIQSGGTPVAVSVSSSQSLRVVYELEINLPGSASAFSINFGGAWGTVTGNMAVQDTIYNAYDDTPLSAVISSGGTQAQLGNAGGLEPSRPVACCISDSAAALQPVGTYTNRTGTASSAKSSVLATYTAGTFYRDRTATFVTTDGDINGIRSIILGDYSYNQHFVALLDAPKNKTNTQTLSITFRVSWAAL